MMGTTLETAYDPLAFQSWPQVTALLILVAGFVIVKWLGTLKEAQKQTGEKVDKLVTTVTMPNGGSSVKDQLNRLEAGQKDLKEKFDGHVAWSQSYVAEAEERIATLEPKPRRAAED